MLIPAQGEKPITSKEYGTWEYCYDTELGKHIYLHRNCDMVAQDGHCIGCGTLEPTLWASDRQIARTVARNRELGLIAELGRKWSK